MTSTYHALVPNADRTALLAVNGRLPVVQADTPRLAEVLELVARSLDLPSAFLRVAGRVKWGEDAVGLINEFDAPPPEWRPPPPAEWLPLEDADAAALAEPELAEPMRVWLDEQRGSPVPPQRSPWARPGWLSQASAWVGEHVEVHGDPRFVRQWPLSAIYRFETSQGPLHLKAAFVLFAREPAITAALATEHRGLVPDVFAIERERGWLLMREFGSRLAGDGDRSR